MVETVSGTLPPVFVIASALIWTSAASIFPLPADKVILSHNISTKDKQTFPRKIKQTVHIAMGSTHALVLGHFLRLHRVDLYVGGSLADMRGAV